MASFGSGGQLLGANANNVLGMPGIQQQSPSSAGFTPGLLPPTSQPMPQQQANPSTQLPQAPAMQSMGAPGPVQPPQGQGVVGMPPQVPETMMILKALIERQKLLGKHEEAVRNAVLPQQMPPSRTIL